MDDKGFIVSLALFIILIVFACAIIMYGATYAESTVKCNNLSSMNPHLEFRMDYMLFCMVQTPSGTWISTDNMHTFANLEK